MARDCLVGERPVLRLALIGLLLLGLGLQDQEPPRHDKYRDDPHAYCFFGKPDAAMPGNPSAHPCECKQTCIVTDGAPITVEDPTCGLYCTKSRCLCHSDEEICQLPDIKP